MQLVIDRVDFRRLSPGTQSELLEVLSGRSPEGQVRKAEAPGLRWRVPYDLPEDIAHRLATKLDETQTGLLRLFAQAKEGRVGMKQLQKLTASNDLKAVTQHLREITRRLRRLIDDPEKKATLVQWDFDATKWDRSKTTIVDGVYYVSERTRSALQKVLGKSGRR